VSDEAAIEIVTSYLRLVEERRLDEASPYLVAGVEIVFPGGRSFSSLAEQVAAAGTRYRSIRKVINGYDVVDGGEATVVYVYGELEGEDVTGTPFAGVRFIDRFELVDGLIANHRVWNDLAEAMRDRESE
jgi:hypothetical protein